MEGGGDNNGNKIRIHSCAVANFCIK
jgi:hypothetical protein